MKKLSLLRHAKSDTESPTGKDFDRSLSDRGLADAGRMGQEIRDLGLRFDLVLASSARRVVETAKSIGGLSPRFDDRIYNASLDQLLDVVRSADDQAESLLMIGHNPGFEQLAASLTSESLDFPTAALVEIELDVDDWREVERGRGRLTHFVSPKELA